MRFSSSFLLVLLLSAVLLFSWSPSFSAAASSSGSTHRLRFALRIRDFDLLERRLNNEISNIESEHYGKHYTVEELRNLHGRSEAELKEFSAWLQSVGAAADSIKVSPANDFVSADFDSSSAAQLLNRDVRLHSLADLVFPETAASQFHSNTGKVSKSHLVSHRVKSSGASHGRRPALSNKEMEMKRNGFKGPFSFQVKTSEAPKSDDLTLGTPANQRTAYGIPATLTGTNAKSTQTVYGTATYGYLPSDLQSYYAGVNLPASEINYITASNSMAGTPGGDNFGEATLDVQCISGIATTITTVVYNNDNSSSTEWGVGFGTAFLAFTSNFFTYPVVSQSNVLSLSLGSLSWDSCNMLCAGAVKLSNGSVSLSQCQSYMQQQRQVCMYDSADTVNRIHQEMAKITATGVTILAASGDGGSHFSFQFFPNDQIGSLLNQISCEYSMPTFPAESPYVLAVGGSDWSQGGYTSPQPWAASGAGASWRFAMPDYQKATVAQYYQRAGSSLPSLNSFNSTNRVYPDVAALATNVPIVMDGSWTPGAGTSASAPEFAAVISLLNDHRLNNGLPPLGFVNPRLYKAAASSYSSMFTDLTNGNTACDSSGNCCSSGFPATTGFDIMTGFGQPLFPGLLQTLGQD